MCKDWMFMVGGIMRMERKGDIGVAFLFHWKLRGGKRLRGTEALFTTDYTDEKG
jgi:hypothetical protein